jgi:hypothetical protein
VDQLLLQENKRLLNILDAKKGRVGIKRLTSVRTINTNYFFNGLKPPGVERIYPKKNVVEGGHVKIEKRGYANRRFALVGIIFVKPH